MIDGIVMNLLVLQLYPDWEIPDKLCPPSIEDVSATYAVSLEFHLLFYRFFLEILTENTKISGFWVHV